MRKLAFVTERRMIHAFLKKHEAQFPKKLIRIKQIRGKINIDKTFEAGGGKVEANVDKF